jgi:hypothetical protein
MSDVLTVTQTPRTILATTRLINIAVRRLRERLQGASAIPCPEGYDACVEAEYLVGWVAQGDVDTLVDKGKWESQRFLQLVKSWD